MGKEGDQIAGRLIEYLRKKVGDPTLDYGSPLTQLRGGFETETYRFTLSGVREELSGPLVLRLYPPFYSGGRAVWESTVQNVLVDQGYPSAKVHFLCGDVSLLDGVFFIMDFLPGKPMIVAPMETIPQLLGETHAALHSIDPAPLLRALSEQGIDPSTCRPDKRSDWLKERAEKNPWIREGVDWLSKNRPPEPEHLAVCHGDFHPLNILVQDGKVTGVLDWPGLLVADPALDVAYTLVLMTVPLKHLSATLDPQLSSVDWDRSAQRYLHAYDTKKPLDRTHLDYYRARRCINALVEGVEGHEVWQHPPVVQDLVSVVRAITGLWITIPD